MSSMTMPMPGQQDHGMLRSAGDAFGPKILAAVGDSLTCLLAHPTILAAHVIAAAMLGWWIAAGERSAARAATVMARPLTTLLSAPTLALPVLGDQGPTAAMFASPPRTSLTSRWLISVAARRGPPVCV